MSEVNNFICIVNRIARNYSIVNELTTEGESCPGLYIRCSSPKNRLWMAPLFISSVPKTLGVLLSEEWILVPTGGLHEFHE